MLDGEMMISEGKIYKDHDTQPTPSLCNYYSKVPGQRWNLKLKRLRIW
jgi:hypothetical protein